MTNVNWAQSPTLAYAAIWLLIVWQAVPFIALTLYAAQSQVPAEYFEAARLDGASEWRIYRTVTLVFLRPTILLFTILSIIWDFNVFNQIWLVSQGGPGNATSTLGIFTYKEAFVSFHLGEGAAIAVVTTVMLMALTAFYVALSSVREKNYDHDEHSQPRPRRRQSQAQRPQLHHHARPWKANLIGLIFSLVWVFPVYWMINTAFKPRFEVMTATPSSFHSTPRSTTSLRPSRSRPS